MFPENSSIDRIPIKLVVERCTIPNIKTPIQIIDAAGQGGSNEDKRIKSLLNEINKIGKIVAFLIVTNGSKTRFL